MQVTTDTSDFDAGLIFEQDPIQIIDALLPLYLNATLLRALQARAFQPSALTAFLTVASVAAAPGAQNGSHATAAGAFALSVKGMHTTYVMARGEVKLSAATATHR